MIDALVVVRLADITIHNHVPVIAQSAFAHVTMAGKAGAHGQPLRVIGSFFVAATPHEPTTDVRVAFSRLASLRHAHGLICQDLVVHQATVAAPIALVRELVRFAVARLPVAVHEQIVLIAATTTTKL